MNQFKVHDKHMAYKAFTPCRELYAMLIGEYGLAKHHAMFVIECMMLERYDEAEAFTQSHRTIYE